ASVERVGRLAGREPVVNAARAWALAGLGRLDEAEAELTEARLLEVRAFWKPEWFVESARTVLAVRRTALHRPPRPLLRLHPPRTPKAPPRAATEAVGGGSTERAA